MKLGAWNFAVDHLPALLRDETWHLLERFHAACVAAGIEAGFASHGARLASAWAQSPFIAEYAIRNPLAFLALCGPPPATGAHARDREQTRAPALDDAATDAEAMCRLRRSRNRELIRLAWDDLTGGTDVTTVMAELSDFADAMIRRAAEWAEKQLAARFGYPETADGRPQRLLIIAMGKLGGAELNFSSDVDLIFVYPASGHTRGGPRQVDNQEYFDRLGKRIIALLHDVTEDGFVFRVDMRLRPFGNSGPLTASFDALEHYYTVHGRDWERYALIKARAITGLPDDIEAFTQLTRPFVYRRYIDFGALEAVREMKALINAEISGEALADDIKRGAGGIREIEFIGQTFQLIRGGREPALQQRAILATLDHCVTLGLLGAAEVAALETAYLFLRRTEHRLQQVRDEQTHRLPQNPRERARLAYGMGYPDWEAFAAALARHRACVAGSFADLSTPQRQGAGAQVVENDLVAALGRFWTTASDDEGHELLRRAGYGDAATALAIVRQLREPRFLERLSRDGHARLDRLMPILIAEVGRRSQGPETLQRLADLIHAVARRSVYLSLLADHPAALSRLVDLYAASPWIAQQITRQPVLLDTLLVPNALFAPPSRADLEHQLRISLAKHELRDLEHQMDTLRSFKHQQALSVAASDVMGRFPVAEVSSQLTNIAEVVVDAALALAWDDLCSRHGEPTCVAAGELRRVGFAVIAYGKLGGRELGYGSDLDLIFLHDSSGREQVTNGARVIDNGVFFTRVAQRLIHLLSTTTAAGQAYEVDVRLRPSGASGLLVSSLDAFAAYQRHSAWTWEHQALVRARGIAGHHETRTGFAAIRAAVLAQERDAARLRDDLLEMRARMHAERDHAHDGLFDLKRGAGGITDIEFMVQYGVLRWAARHRELLGNTSNLRLLQTFADLELLPRAHCEILHDAYFAYRAEAHRRDLQQIDDLVDEAAFGGHRAAVAAVWRQMFSTATI